jgi:hypothetical protein
VPLVAVKNCFAVAVASSGIEPESGASETLILSIVRRGLKFQIPNLKFRIYFPNFTILLPKILTAMANNITPKNFLITVMPLGPKTFSIHFKDLSTK